jgi:predicted ribonuclease YlaK
MALDILLDDENKIGYNIRQGWNRKTLLAMAAGLQKVVEEGNYSRWSFPGQSLR